MMDRLETAIRLIDGLMADRFSHLGSPSLVVRVVIDQDLAWAEGYGVAEFDADGVPDECTIARVASIMKTSLPMPFFSSGMRSCSIWTILSLTTFRSSLQ